MYLIKVVKLTSCILGAYVSVKYLHSTFLSYKEKSRLALIREQRQCERRNQFAEFKTKYGTNLDEKTKEKYSSITKLTVIQLQEKLRTREILAEDVLKAYINAALKAQDEFNCITEFIPNAIEKARELDKMHMVAGPLHGIVFCVKDDTEMEGFDCTIGCTRRLYKPCKETAVIVQSLEQLGAIPFCRTNVPQTCISFGSSNPVFGKTLNPLNKRLGPGGSSSGTGCLVAAGGSPFGTGSDTGGSLRVPAHFCGISTIKATSSRLSRRGVTKCLEYCPAVPGVLAKTSADVALVFKFLNDNNLQNKLDGIAAPISWNSQIFESKQRLRIGYVNGMANFPPIGDTELLIGRAKTFLESTGHVLVPFEFPFDPNVLLSLPMDSNLKKRLLDNVKDDEIAPAIKNLYADECNPTIMQRIIKLFTSGKDTEIPNREHLIHTFLDKMNAEKVDIIICPVFPFPAISIEDEDVPSFDVIMHTMMWNWLDFPAGVTKFWTETGTNWVSSVNALQKSQVWKDVLLRDGPDCVGMPMGVQVVGRPYHEELVLKIMVELDDINLL